MKAKNILFKKASKIIAEINHITNLTTIIEALEFRLANDLQNEPLQIALRWFSDKMHQFMTKDWYYSSFSEQEYKCICIEVKKLNN